MLTAVLRNLASALAVRVHKALGRSDIYFAGSLYMRRWRIGPKWGPGLRLHHILRSDRDRELHDHPFSWVSIILYGGYTEHREDGSATYYPPGSILFRRAETLHRLELDGDAWTLVFRGPMRRPWGFMTERGWVPWQQFVGVGEAVTPRSEARPFAAGSSV